MRAIVQRIERAEVEVDGGLVAKTGSGLLVYLSVGPDDSEDDCHYMADKLTNLRIFEDDRGKMNLSLLDTKGQCLIISNFTLHGDCRKGRRPRFRAAPPEMAEPLYDKVAGLIEQQGVSVQKGVFAAHMDVAAINDGPINLLIDSKRAF